MIDRKKVFPILVVLATLVASITMMVGQEGRRAVFAQRAQAQAVSSTEYQIPTGADAWGTAFDSSGNVWVALPGCDFTPMCGSTTPGKIIRFAPTSTSWTATYTLPSGFGQPIFLAFDPSGNLWFTMPSTNSLGELNPSNGTVQQFVVPTSAAGPWGITVASDGTVWFTEHYTNQIGSFNPSTHQFHEIATAASNTVPYGITIDTSNNIWFTENNPSIPAVAEYTASGSLREFPIPPNGNSLTPHLITIDTNGNIWWSEGWLGAIGKLNVSQAVTGTSNGISQYSYHLSGTHTSGIGADSNGTIWFDDSVHSIYGSFPQSGTGSFSIYNTVSSNAHPHDGLNIDQQNRVWFNEQFLNKLVLVNQSGGTATPTPSPTSTNTPTATPTPGQTIGTDTFQRANQAYWGNASDGQTWEGDANTISAFSISGNKGLVTSAGSNTYNSVLGATATDAQVLVSGSLSSFSNANFGAVLRWMDGNNWYKAYIDGGTFYIQKKVAGTATTLVSTPFSAQANTSYSIRFQVSGTTLNARVWPTSGTEPTSWMLTTSDSSLSSGHVGIRVLTQAGTATFTSFQATTLINTPTPTPTSTNTPTPTPTSTNTPTPTPTSTNTPTPTPGQSLGTDTFQRANQAHWGNASDGQTWGGDANTINAFSISGNKGLVTSAGSNTYSAVLGATATNAQALVSGSLSSFSNANFGTVLRWTDGNNWYKAYIDGGTFYIQKKVAGTTTTLASTPFSAQANTSYSIRFQVSGTTLNARVWPTSGTEPTSWMLTTSDSSLSSGYVGIRVLTQGGTATFTSFQAMSI